MTRRQTGQEHSYLVERLIADSSRSYRPRTRKSVVAGIGRRAIVKGTYGSKVVPRQKGTSEKVSSSAISTAATSESVVTSQSGSSASSLGTEGLSQSLAGAGVTGSSIDMEQPFATGDLSTVGQTETRETDTSSETNYLKVAASASVTNSVTSAMEKARGSQSLFDFDLVSRISTFDNIAPSATDRVSNVNSDSESNSGILTVTSSTGSISSTDSLFVSATGTDDSSSSSGASSQIDTTSALTTFAQSIWAQPLDSSASLTGVMSQNNAIVYTIDVTIGEGGITLPVLVDTGSADICVAARGLRTDAELLFSPHADQSKKITLPKSTTGDGLYRVIMDGFISHGYMVQSSNSSVSMEKIEVILDTGTSDIRVPEDMLLPIYAALGNDTYYFDTTTGDLVVPCKSNDDAALALQFGGQQFYLSWQDLIVNPSSTDANYCYCRVQASPSAIRD
uniref:Peptidase A1 domain-containing protein n=1 Tax=Cryptococcus bacillisporus CA1280 TaxID=1296109 RepID=A0A0D0UDG5_CRYGA|nr:hypothetical protein I312_04391 [Cryptococcus bacillisporus CA1280]